MKTDLVPLEPRKPLALGTSVKPAADLVVPTDSTRPSQASALSTLLGTLKTLRIQHQESDPTAPKPFASVSLTTPSGRHLSVGLKPVAHQGESAIGIAPTGYGDHSKVWGVVAHGTGQGCEVHGLADAGASGPNCLATSPYRAIAKGYAAEARGFFHIFAFGDHARAHATVGGIAFGAQAEATSGELALAGGDGSKATGRVRAVAAGPGATAEAPLHSSNGSPDEPRRLGSRTLSLGRYKIGWEPVVGDGEVAIGFRPTAYGHDARTFGVFSEVQGDHNQAFGLIRTHAVGDHSQANGVFFTLVEGDHGQSRGMLGTFLLGNHGKTQGIFGSVAVGNHNQAQGMYCPWLIGDDGQAVGGADVLALGTRSEARGLIMPHTDDPLRG